MPQTTKQMTKTQTNQKPLFKVYKVGRKSCRRSIIRKGLTEQEAQTLVKSFPNSNRSMVCYTRQ
jgi:hypothetical protein